ncbi:MAG TPA: phosphatidylserine decarboxylase, partial [Campylobacterales bacterium]|nr:phosphatidylserine decarboxylase [Campylobacterales bacterium]
MFSHFISKQFGRFADTEFAPSIQNLINKTYIRIFDISLDEHEPIESYKSLNALFTRKLVKKRELKGGENSLVAPADCR